jgi:hypothetical protein
MEQSRDTLDGFPCPVWKLSLSLSLTLWKSLSSLFSLSTYTDTTRITEARRGTEWVRLPHIISKQTAADVDQASSHSGHPFLLVGVKTLRRGKEGRDSAPGGLHVELEAATQIISSAVSAAALPSRLRLHQR